MPQHFRPLYLAALQSALADNLRVLMDDKYSQISSEDDRVEELRKAAGIGRNTVYRILKPEQQAEKGGTYTYPRLDNLAKLARALSISVPQLLTADFAAGHVAAKAVSKRIPRRAAGGLPADQ